MAEYYICKIFFQFDLIIHDYLMGGCLLAFANKFKNVPIIGMTAFNDNFKLTSYLQSSLVPSISPFPYYNHNVNTFVKRAHNFVIHMADKIIFQYYTVPNITKMIKDETSFKDSPSLLELGRKFIMFMTNYDPSIDGIQQIPANSIPVGGLQIKAANPLPEV